MFLLHDSRPCKQPAVIGTFSVVKEQKAVVIRFELPEDQAVKLRRYAAARGLRAGVYVKTLVYQVLSQPQQSTTGSSGVS